MLAARWGLERRVILRWMRANGFYSVVDLKARWPGEHAACMDAARADLESFHMGETRT